MIIHQVRVETLLSTDRDKSPNPNSLLRLPYTTLGLGRGGVRMLSSSLTRVSRRLLIGPLQVRDGCVCGVWLEQSGIVPVLSFCAAAFLVLWLQRTDFCWGLLWSAPVGVSGLSASSAWSLNIWGKTKIQGIYHDVVPWVLRSLAVLSSSLHLSESPYICLMYDVQRFFIVPSRRIRKNYLLHLPGSEFHLFLSFFSVLYMFLIGKAAYSIFTVVSLRNLNRMIKNWLINFLLKKRKLETTHLYL